MTSPGWATSRRTPHLPVVADESVRTLADVEALAAVGVRGINLKLMKVGGLTPAVRILERARALAVARDVGLHDRDFAQHDGRGPPHGPRGLGWTWTRRSW